MFFCSMKFLAVRYFLLWIWAQSSSELNPIFEELGDFSYSKVTAMQLPIADNEILACRPYYCAFASGLDLW